MTDRKKPGVAFWTTVALGVVLLYVASIGPVNWACHRFGAPDWVWNLIAHVYEPLLMVLFYCPESLFQWFIEYSMMGAPPIEL